jgi:diguanylate cyclase (GGDEF)-like protein/PAS domain S-box-containing protein
LNLQHKTKAALLAEIEQLRRRVATLESQETENRQALEELREDKEKYRLLLDESSDPIFMFSSTGQYRYVNQAFAGGVGKPLSEIIGKTIWDVFPREEADKRYAVVKWVFENGATKVIEVRVPRAEGDRYYITTAKPIFDHRGAVVSVLCISKEITERKRMERELQYLSSHDLLCGLYNRNFFEVELARFQNSRLFPVSIVLADLDDLKIINDLYGHTAGDELIRKAAQVLQQSFRTEDIVARIGGDEFAILLPQTDPAAAQSAIVRLRAQLDMLKDDRLGLSIGFATGIESCNLLEIMHAADQRMYQDKMKRKERKEQKADE